MIADFEDAFPALRTEGFEDTPGRRVLPADADGAAGGSCAVGLDGDRQLGDSASQRLGLICSVRCPGSIVIKTFDAVRQLRDAGVVVAGGFHSPMEKECLDFLLRGEQPVIVCPPKGLARPRLPREWRAAVDAGRLLVLSPFGLAVTRTTGAQAQARNEFVAALSHAVLIPHASPGGKAEAVGRKSWTEASHCLRSTTRNTELLHRGAQPYHIDRLDRYVLDESS
jgi:hypothetical protein